MKRDPAIEKIRETRREISERYGHDTRALIAHHRTLEEKYADRVVRDAAAESGSAHAVDDRAVGEYP